MCLVIKLKGYAKKKNMSIRMLAQEIGISSGQILFCSNVTIWLYTINRDKRLILIGSFVK